MFSELDKHKRERQTPETKNYNTPSINESPVMSRSKRERSPVEFSPSPRQFGRSPTPTPKRTFTIPGSKATSVSSCSVWSPDVCHEVHITIPKKQILNIPSSKRRALMGYNLPEINEQNYLSCPAISKVTTKERVKTTDLYNTGSRIQNILPIKF